MNILRFPDLPRTGDRPGGPAGEACAQPPPPGRPPTLSDARILHSLSLLNRPILDAVLSRRPKAHDVLAAFRAEWTPPRPRTPRPANDADTSRA